MKKIISIYFLAFSVFCSSQQKANLHLVCDKITKKNVDSLDEIIIRTCFLKNYKFIATGSPDYKGRYYWNYKSYKKKNGKYIKIKNSDIFSNSKKLENLINNQIKKQYDIDKQSNSDCIYFEYRTFTLDEMGISFDELQNIQFNTRFDLASACLNVDINIIPFTLKEIESYLKE